MVALVLLRPYKNKKVQKIKIISETLFLIGTIVMILIPYYETTITEIEYIAYGIIIGITFGVAGIIELVSFFSNKIKLEFKGLKKHSD